MKHVSWILALVDRVRARLGRERRHVDPPRGAPASGRRRAQPQRPARPTEDPRAVYRVPLDDSPTKGPGGRARHDRRVLRLRVPVLQARRADAEAARGARTGARSASSFKHNPLPFHARALPAAIATEEARAQGGDAKFWAMHDALFARGVARRGRDPPGREGGRPRRREGEGRDRVRPPQGPARARPAARPGARRLRDAVVLRERPQAHRRAAVRRRSRRSSTRSSARRRRSSAPGRPRRQVYAKIMERAASAPVYVPGAARRRRPAQAGAPAQQPPAPPPALYREVPVRADDPARGPADAKLTVVLFSDFQCPFCSRVEPSLAQLEQAFPGQRPDRLEAPAAPDAPAGDPGGARRRGGARAGQVLADAREALREPAGALARRASRAHAKEIGLDARRFEQAMAARRGEARDPGGPEARRAGRARTAPRRCSSTAARSSARSRSSGSAPSPRRS